MIVLVLTALGVVSATFSRSRLRRLAELPIVGLWLVWTAFITQIVVFEVVGYFIPVLLSNIIHLMTYALCLAFLYRNRHVPGGWIITLGATSNLAAIVANGGTMPADATAWSRAGLPEPTAFENSSFDTDARLAVLGDIFYIPADWPLSNVFSIGDVLIVIGGTYLAHRWCATSTRGFHSNDSTVADERSTFDAPNDSVLEPVAAEPAALAEAIDDLRTRFEHVGSAIAQAEALRLEAATLRDEARNDVERTRRALLELLRDIEQATQHSSPDDISADNPRLDRIEQHVDETRHQLTVTIERQREIIDVLTASLDDASVDA